MNNEFTAEARRSEARLKAMNLRYKKPALLSIGWNELNDALYNIEEACSDVHWYLRGENEENLVAALDGDEDEAYEFKMAFADIEAKCDTLRSAIEELGWDASDYFDDCTVALLGRTHRLVGYDTYEEDYYALTSYESDLAETEVGKRLMKFTKADLIGKIGQCMRITLAYIDLRQQYDYLQSALDVLRGENQSILKIIKEVDAAYNEIFTEISNSDSERTFERLVCDLPDRVWIEC